MCDYGKKISEGMGNIKMDLGLNNKESLFVDSHAAVAAQNDSVEEWAQNNEDREVVNTCHTEERSDVSIHRIGTQSQTSEEYHLSLDSHGSNEPQNDGVEEWTQNDKTGYIPNTTHTEELFPFCHTEERSDVSIHRTRTQPQNSEIVLNAHGFSRPKGLRMTGLGNGPRMIKQDIFPTPLIQRSFPPLVILRSAAT